jgi:hypothetical protein
MKAFRIATTVVSIVVVANDRVRGCPHPVRFLWRALLAITPAGSVWRVVGVSMLLVPSYVLFACA